MVLGRNLFLPDGRLPSRRDLKQEGESSGPGQGIKGTGCGEDPPSWPAKPKDFPNIIPSRRPASARECAGSPVQLLAAACCGQSPGLAVWWELVGKSSGQGHIHCSTLQLLRGVE